MNSINLCDSNINKSIIKIYHYKDDGTNIYFFLGNNYEKFKTKIELLDKKNNKPKYLDIELKNFLVNQANLLEEDLKNNIFCINDEIFIYI